ncbi:hypothetical protein BDZ94DRAFT_854508 [Collybia nuda]|uniref:DUF6534 domain-containing protein n=1 Tax=Collybia nuda TaxID=64659 RepID=A0A9P6CHR6_9AGAR|nr:hypothetical protein BDZ94DRAFT_854508 [Collybia nuda]
MLGGITVIQAVTFLQTSKRDPLQHKLVVYFLLFLDLLHLFFFSHSVYYYLVSNPDYTKLIWSVPAFVLVHDIVISLAQLFYVARLWKLIPRNYIYIPIILIMMILTDLSLGIVIYYDLSKTTTFALAVNLISSAIFRAFFALKFCSDFVIAISMIFSLAKTNTYLSWTDSSSTMLLAYLLNTGLIPSVLSTVVFITALRMPDSLVFLAIEEIATKLHVNSFMGMLNARYYLQSPAPKTKARAFFLRSETLSNDCPMDKLHTQAPAKTINEVGLPLFQSESRGDEIDKEIRVEVAVKQDTC